MRFPTEEEESQSEEEEEESEGDGRDEVDSPGFTPWPDKPMISSKFQGLL